MILILVLSAQGISGGITRTLPPTVFVVVMENQNWQNIVGNSAAPYINRTLLRMAAHAGRYYTPRGLHPSLSNYLWLEAGTNFGIRSDAGPEAAHQRTGSHLVTLLRRRGITWKSYQEGISGTTCPLVDRYPYATRHNPMVYFDDITNRNNPKSRYCIAHERPFNEMARDLRTDRVAHYNFITPDVCDDMHDACSPYQDSVRQGDIWLSRSIPRIVSSRAYRRNGYLFIVWDEGKDGADGPIGLLALGPHVKHGYTSNVRYTHSSTLRSIQEIFGLSPMLGDAAHASDLSDLFVRFPRSY